jgi:hypothetical protein
MAAVASPQGRGRMFWEAVAREQIEDELMFLPPLRHDYQMPTMHNIEVAALRRLIAFESEQALKMAKEAGLL